MTPLIAIIFPPNRFDWAFLFVVFDQQISTKKTYFDLLILEELPSYQRFVLQVNSLLLFHV